MKIKKYFIYLEYIINKGSILLFALSTCGWCKKVKDLLDELNVEYDYVYADLTQGEERNKIVSQLKNYNSKISFPTLIINETNVIVGYNPDEIKELLI